MSRMSLQEILNEELFKQTKYHETRIHQIYSFPASIKKAKIHQRANAFGYNSRFVVDDKGKKGKPSICPCCQLPINTKPIKLKYGTTPLAEKVKEGGDVYLLNSGTSMFFTFIKMAVIYLLIRFLITDIYNLISSTLGSYCNDSSNDCSTLAKLSAFNKKTQEDEGMVNVVDILNMICAIVSIVFFILYRKFQFKIYNIAETSSFSQDDYTLLVENIPIFIPQVKGKQIPYQDHIKKAFEDQLKPWIQTVQNLPQQRLKGLEGDFYARASEKNFDKQPIVRSISLCFDLTQMEKMKNLRQSLMDEHISNVQSKIDVPEASSPFYVPNQIKTVNGEYIQLSKRFSTDQSSAFNLSHFVGRAYVSFQYQHYCEFLMRQYQANNVIKLHGRPLTISAASQPSDVYWFNMRIDDSERSKSIFKSYLVLIMTLTFAFGALVGLQLLQSKGAPGQPAKPAVSTNATTQNAASVPEQNLILSYGFTLLMTILINIVNYILTLTIDTLTQSQKHQSKTDEITSLIIKNIIAQFFNTALIYYIITLMNPLIQPLSQNGIVVKIMSLVAVSGVVNIVMNALQLGSLVTWLLNKWRYGNKTQVDLFQVQLNQNLQDPEFSFAQRYAYYIVQVYVVSFYACIAPSTTIILALIFVAQYWVDKFNLFKQRFSCPTEFNFQLSRLTIKIFEVSVLVFAVGNLIFSPQLHVSDEQAYHIINWITFGLAFIFVTIVIIMPKKWQQKLFYYETVVNESYTFCLKGNHFKQFYFKINPATSFAKERDLNNPNDFVKYGEEIKKIASQFDFEHQISNDLKQDSVIQKYDEKDVKVVEQILLSFAGKVEPSPPQK